MSKIKSGPEIRLKIDTDILNLTGRGGLLQSSEYSQKHIPSLNRNGRAQKMQENGKLPESRQK